jgi:hypothetical protein
MNRRFGTVALMFILAALVFSCAPHAAKAPKAASNKGITMYVLIDRGIEKSYTDYQIKNRDQVGEYMEQDLPYVLKKSGYNAKLITRRSEYRPAQDTYLLTVRITDYNPGAKAARMFVGYGAGAASMKTHYELHKGSNAVLKGDPGVGSGRDWRNVIRKINEITVTAVSEKLGE